MEVLHGLLTPKTIISFTKKGPPPLSVSWILELVLDLGVLGGSSLSRAVPWRCATKSAPGAQRRAALFRSSSPARRPVVFSSPSAELGGAGSGGSKDFSPSTVDLHRTGPPSIPRSPKWLRCLKRFETDLAGADLYTRVRNLRGEQGLAPSGSKVFFTPRWCQGLLMTSFNHRPRRAWEHIGVRVPRGLHVFLLPGYCWVPRLETSSCH